MEMIRITWGFIQISHPLPFQFPPQDFNIFPKANCVCVLGGGGSMILCLESLLQTSAVIYMTVLPPLTDISYFPLIC